MSSRNAFSFLATILFVTAVNAEDTSRIRSSSRIAPGAVRPMAVAARPVPPAPVLPPLPDGVAELKFGDFFKTPVGPRGLELTDKLRSLDGKRVRILGHMVHEEAGDEDHAHAAKEEQTEHKRASGENGIPGRIMLTPMPQTVSISHYGLCDDLPPQTLFVTAPDRQRDVIPHTPGLLLLTGKLSVGPHAEPDGRSSIVRLTLDPPAAAGASANSSAPSPASQAVGAVAPNKTNTPRQP